MLRTFNPGIPSPSRRNQTVLRTVQFYKAFGGFPTDSPKASEEGTTRRPVYSGFGLMRLRHPG